MSNETVRVGLNGFGRIGRNVFRASLDSDAVEIVGINDVMEDGEIEYLARYDSVMGRLDGASLDDGTLSVDGTDLEAGVFHETDPTQLPWKELDVDVAFEATGIFRSHEDASQHLDAGADKVVISAPPKGDTPVKQLVYGVNHDEYNGQDIVSNASCTTNSITPVAKILNEEFGIESGQLTTVHAYTGTQNLIDGPNSKPRRRRAAAENIIPTTTGAAQAATEVLPGLEGKLDGMAMRVPVPDGSITEFVCTLEDDATEGDINAVFRDAAAGEMEGVLGVSDDAIVSRDVLGQPYSTLVDLENTNIVNGLVKVLTWYDNEFGFANRMLDLAEHIHE
ncbi:type I glyceraldehyde-3-phosphate dehydrogenase [Halobacteriales archaeon QS_4_62_28]|nr:MAG: type I glyceraldehyde-3-phosphate dehydrogenase [Halobacteriales archaeon QS_4_62_28]